MIDKMRIFKKNCQIAKKCKNFETVKIGVDNSRNKEF